MRRRLLPRWLVVILFLWVLPVTGLAEEGEAQEITDEEREGSEEVPEGSEVPEDSEAADEDGEEVIDAESEGGEEAPEALGEDGEAAPAEEQQEEVQQGEQDEAAEEREVVEGPGGAPLETDYPGTEESLQPRMDTGRVAGLEIPDAESGEEVYDLRVRELETQIDDLKERVFRSKSRIALLRETVLAENLAGSRAIISFDNDLGRRYNIERAIFSVDGNQVYSTVDTAEFDSGDEIEVFNSALTPGTHTVSVTLGLRGSGYGVFSYAEGYEFDLRFSCQFTAEEGRTTLVTVQSYKSGNTLTAHEERPDGMCQVSTVELDIDDIDGDGGDGGDEDIPAVD